MIINKGRLVTFSPLTELTARLSCGVRVRAPGIARLQSALEAKGVRSTILDGNELMVEGAPSARVGDIAFNAGFPLHELVPREFGGVESLAGARTQPRSLLQFQ